VLELRALDHETDVAGRIACHLDRVRGPVAVVPPFREQERTAETTRDDQRHQSFVSMAESDSPLCERRQAASMPRPPDRDPGHGYRDNGSAGGNPSGDINHDNKSTPKAGGVMSGQPIIFDFTVSIGGMTAPIARVTLDGAGEQGSSLLSLQLAEDIPDFVRSMSSAAADQIGKALLMDAKTDAGFLPSITLADYLPKGVTIDANPKAKA